MIVVAIIGIMAGVVFPGVSAGWTHPALHRLRFASQLSQRRAESRRAAAGGDRDLHFGEGKLHAALLTEPGFERQLELPDGVRIEAVLPAADESAGPAPFLLQPGGTPPRVGVAIVNRRGTRRIVRVDPMTGLPRIESPEDAMNAAHAGFTLLEMMVATVIMGIAVVGLLSGISSSMRNAGG